LQGLFEIEQGLLADGDQALAWTVEIGDDGNDDRDE
jgi:hypothetical protein